MAGSNLDILRGTLDLLILRATAWGPIHGYDIARWIDGAAGEVLTVGEGTLYPALHRLEARGWLEASWGLSDNNRRAKFYTLTPSGRAALRREERNFTKVAQVILAALAAPPLNA